MLHCFLLYGGRGGGVGKMYASGQITTFPLLFSGIFQGERRIPLYTGLLRTVLKVMDKTRQGESSGGYLHSECQWIFPPVPLRHPFRWSGRLLIERMHWNPREIWPLEQRPWFMGTEVHAPASQSGVLLRAPRWRVLNDKSFQVLLPLCVKILRLEFIHSLRNPTTDNEGVC